jgi:hypothetical protein
MADHREYCKKCGKVGTYNGEYDAYWCKDCGTWISSKCGDENCGFCQNRSVKPPKAEPGDSHE